MIVFVSSERGPNRARGSVSEDRRAAIKYLSEIRVTHSWACKTARVIVVLRDASQGVLIVSMSSLDDMHRYAQDRSEWLHNQGSVPPSHLVLSHTTIGH
jgi:dihydroorotase-like cyclic amidohydrolase